MPEDTSDQEKTEEPSQHRLEEARGKGQVAHSKEVVTVAVFFAGVIYFNISLNANLAQMKRILSDFLSFDKYLSLNVADAPDFFLRVLLLCAPILAPLFILIVFMGLVSNFAQVGFLFSSEKFKVDLDKLNPAKGIKRLFGKQQLIEGPKTIIKVILVTVIGFFTVRAKLEDLLTLSQMELEQEFRFITGLCLSLAFRVAMAMIVFAAFDYAFQRFVYMKKLRMTKQELKDEMKEKEGDPLVKQRMRSIHMEQARKRMMAEVPTADVVVTNPIHYAVALRYDKGEMPAPTVVAKGQRLIAEKIKEIAREHDVPIYEDPPLARTLFKECNIGDLIPFVLYQAVAEVLAFVYKISKKGKNWL